MEESNSVRWRPIARAWFASCFAIGFAVLSFAAEPRRQIDELVAKALKSRDGIASYHLVVHEETALNAIPGAVKEIRKYRHEVWFANGKNRTDRTILESNVETLSGQIGQRSITCRNCERPGFAITNNQGDKFVSSLKYEKMDAEFENRDWLHFDWKQMGLLHESLGKYHSRSADSSLRGLQRMDKPEVESKIEGQMTLHTASVSGQPGAIFTCTFRPDYSNNPVRYLTRSAVRDPAEKPMEKVTEIEYSNANSAGIYYPKVIRHRLSQGGVPTFDQTLKFETVELNEPIPVSVFTLAGLALKKGTPIEVPEIQDIRKQPTWGDGHVDRERTRGKQADEYYAKLESQSSPVPDIPEPGRTWPFYVAGFFGVLAAGLFVKVLKSRRASQ